MRRYALAALAAPGVFALLPTAPAAAESRVVFARGESLWTAPLEPEREGEREVAPLGLPASEIVSIDVDARGEIALAQTAGEAMIAELSADGRVRRVPCEPPAHLSAGGDAVLCRRGESPALFELERPVVRVFSGAGGEPAGFLGESSDEAVVTDGEAVCAVSFSRYSRRCLAPHGPDGGDLLPAPDGQRAAAAYERDGESALYGFALDGEGVRRVLMTGARAVAWSRDSSWIAARRGGRACLVRAVGGQYQCWRDYRAVDVAPDGAHILLARGDAHVSIYRAPLEGTRPAEPQRVVENAHAAAAAWLPAAGDAP